MVGAGAAFEAVLAWQFVFFGRAVRGGDLRYDEHVAAGGADWEGRLAGVWVWMDGVVVEGVVKGGLQRSIVVVVVGLGLELGVRCWSGLPVRTKNVFGFA